MNEKNKKTLERIQQTIRKWKAEGYVPLDVKVSRKEDVELAYFRSAFHYKKSTLKEYCGKG